MLVAGGLITHHRPNEALKKEKRSVGIFILKYTVMINKIYRVNFMRDRFSYVGLLRNEKVFNINDRVFFSIDNHSIAVGRIVGVELPPEQNPEYKYKIELPEELIRQRMENKDFYEGKDIDKVELDCEKIFSTIKEAKDSALKNLERMAKLQRTEIERYFKQFEEL